MKQLLLVVVATLSTRIHVNAITMRVLLVKKEVPITQANPHQFLTPDPCFIFSGKQRITHTQKTLSISGGKDGLVYFHEHNKTLPLPITLQPQVDTKIGLSKKPYIRFYQGFMRLQRSPDKQWLYIINHVPLEEYVYGVVIKEMNPQWHTQAHCAQAIAARSYALHLKHLVNRQKTYDVRASEGDQMYIGDSPRWQHVKKEIESTKGTILTSNHKPILAMFAACCGGIIPSKTNDFNAKKHAYLKRDTACTFCKGAMYGNTPVHSWSHTFSKKEFLTLCKKQKDVSTSIRDFESLKSIVLTHNDGSKVVNVTLSDGTQEVCIPPKIFKRHPNKKALSYYFTLEDKGDQFSINGRGYGHPIGLCQQGAQKMATDGASYDEILTFYYPAAQLHTLPLE